MSKNIDHLPGNKGLPVVGEILNISKEGVKYFENRKEKYGEVYKFRMPTGMVVGFLGEKAAITLLKNHGNIVNIGNATKDLLGPIYPNSIMLMDGEQHKKDRSILMQAFKRKALSEYITKMPKILEQTLEEIRDKKNIKVYPMFKTLVIRITGKLFFGIEDEVFLKKVNEAITPMGIAMVSIPVNLPGTAYNKGLKGRKYLSKEFLKLAAQKRKHPGNDFFSKLCIATNEDGDTFTDQEIVDHLLFLYQGAYDTTSWALSNLVYRLSKAPEWQEKMRDEVKHIDLKNIDLHTILGLKTSTMIFNEAMRLSPSVPLTIREANEDLKLNEDVTVPKGTKIWVSMTMGMRDPKHWKDPEAFDPGRFSEDRQEHKKCPHAFLPFGAGPHQCIGRVFAEIIVKMMMTAILKEFRFSVPDNYKIDISEFPIMRPKDGLPVQFEKI